MRDVHLHPPLERLESQQKVTAVTPSEESLIPTLELVLCYNSRHCCDPDFKMPRGANIYQRLPPTIVPPPTLSLALFLPHFVPRLAAVGHVDGTQATYIMERPGFVRRPAVLRRVRPAQVLAVLAASARAAER